MGYDEIQPYLEEHKEKTIYMDFKEYGNVSYNIKAPVLEITGYEVVNYFNSYEVITMEDVYLYYGEEGLKEYQKYLIDPHIRLVISPTEYTQGERTLHVIHLNETAFVSGYQEIKLYTSNQLLQGNQPKPWVNI